MRITEHLLDPDKTGPWADIAKQAARKFRQTTGRTFDAEWLNLASMMDRRPEAMIGEVAWGFARRAVRKMHSTCSACGLPARQRRGNYRGVYLCASCQLPYAFQNQLNALLRAQEESSGAARSVLGQHHLPPLVRNVIPSHMWRGFGLSDGSTVKYITDRDLESIETWLLRLAFILEQDAAKRASARLQTVNTG